MEGTKNMPKNLPQSFIAYGNTVKVATQFLPIILSLVFVLLPMACTPTPQQPTVVWITVLGTDNMPAEDVQVYSSVGYIKRISNG